MQKLTKKSQQRLYAVAGMGVNTLNLMMGSYLCSALLVGGFGEAAVPYQTYAQKDLVIVGLWSVFVLIAKIVDGLIDIPMASFTDQLRSRWGRRRPSLLIGFIPMILSYTLFLVIPNPQGVTLLNTVYYFVVLCVFYSSYTLTMVTYYATFTEIVDTEEERNRISTTKSVFDIVYFILGYVVIRMLLNGMNIRLVALIVLPLTLTMMIPLFMIKEESSLNMKSRQSKIRTVSLVESFRRTFRNKTYIRWLLVNACMTFGVQLFLGGINEYFSFVGMSMIKVMVAAFVPVPLTLIIYNRLFRKYGFGTAFRYTMAIFSVSMIIMFLVGRMENGGTKDILAIAAGLISSFAIGAIFSVSYSVPSQLAAEQQEDTGISNSAMFFAVQGLFQGTATGIATGPVLNALKGTEAAHSDAIMWMTAIAAAGTLIALLLTWTLPKSLMLMGKKAEHR